MRIVTTRLFEKDYADLPEEMKDIADKQLKLLMENPRHPSLRVKKMEDPRKIWEGRITRSYRFTFQIHNDFYMLRRIGSHDILKNP